MVYRRACPVLRQIYRCFSSTFKRVAEKVNDLPAPKNGAPAKISIIVNIFDQNDDKRLISTAEFQEIMRKTSHGLNVKCVHRTREHFDLWEKYGGKGWKFLISSIKELEKNNNFYRLRIHDVSFRSKGNLLMLTLHFDQKAAPGQDIRKHGPVGRDLIHCTLVETLHGKPMPRPAKRLGLK